MWLSDRITGLTGGEGDGWGLFLRARAMVAAGLEVVELTIGEHDIGTRPDILAAMDRAARGGQTGYAPVPGTDGLRDAVAARLTERSGVATVRDNVLIVPGAQAGLFAAHAAVCDAGERALFIDPFYATYPGTIRAVGAVPVAVEARAQDGFQPDAGAIEGALEGAAPGARSLLINTPNNPTGVIYTRETLEAIARLCRRHDLWLISDEVYDSQVWEGEHLSPRALPGMEERSLVVGSMSKSHAMTGSRIGWIVGPEEAITHLINLATHTTYGVPGYIQDAALFALEQGDGLEAEIAAPFARRREIAMELIAAQNVVRLVPSGGTMYVMLDVSATGMSGAAFAEALLEEARIAVMPGASFGRAARGHVRVALTVEDGRFAEAFARLLAFAAQKAGEASDGPCGA